MVGFDDEISRIFERVDNALTYNPVSKRRVCASRAAVALALGKPATCDKSAIKKTQRKFCLFVHPDKRPQAPPPSCYATWMADLLFSAATCMGTTIERWDDRTRDLPVDVPGWPCHDGTRPRAPGDPHPDSTDEEERRAAHLRWAHDKADRLERMRDTGDTNTPAVVDD